MRAAAVGTGITYEALTGDLSQVNFTSGRMGRMEMNANVSSWQWLLMIPQMMLPISDWFMEAYRIVNPQEDIPRGDAGLGAASPANG
jgi:capsid protein